ncbi:MAG: putative acetyltransferase [Firmicutes bacterium]|nr:putative acetyltransferase [Bacillota bacterium]
MEIRAAVPGDESAVVSCVNEAFSPYIPLIGLTPGPMLEDYHAALQNHPLFVAIADDLPVGVVLLKDAPGEDYMWLDVLATRTAVRGRGIGQALIAFSEDYMRSQGKQECRLYTHVKYQHSIDLYQYLGYEITHRIQEYGYDRYYMRKLL